MQEPQNNMEHGPTEVTKTVRNVKPLFFGFFALFLIVIFSLFSYYLGSQTKSVEISEVTSDSQSLEVQNTATPPNTKEQSSVADFYESEELYGHKDLQTALATQEVQSAYQVVINESPKPYQGVQVHDKVWIIESIDKSYLSSSEGQHDQKPRFQYLVTSDYWNKLDSPFVVECIIDEPTISSTTFSEDDEIILVLKRNWNCPSATTLIRYSDGQIIPFTDPKQLIPDSRPYVVSEAGATTGVFKNFVFADNLLIEVSLGNAVVYGHGYFNAKTGVLEDLVLFE